MHASKQGYRIGPGASSLLMIFVALCMTALGVLTLISALNDTNLTRRNEATITAYYAGAALAQQQVARVDALLLDARSSSATVDEYREAVYAIQAEELQLTVNPGQREDEALLTFSAPMYGSHEIYVALRIPLQLTGTRYHMVEHLMQDTSVWTPDEELDLYVPEQGSA